MPDLVMDAGDTLSREEPCPFSQEAYILMKGTENKTNRVTGDYYKCCNYTYSSIKIIKLKTHLKDSTFSIIKKIKA